MSKLFDPAYEDWGEFATGKSGDITLETEFLRGLQNMYQVFVKKNHDYGSHNLATAWVRGIVIRLGDKVSRLWTLCKVASCEKEYEQSHVLGEAREDTFLDIANYGLIGWMMETGKWGSYNVSEAYGHKAAAKLLAKIYGDMPEEERKEVLEYIMAAEIARDLKAKVVFQ